MRSNSISTISVRMTLIVDDAFDSPDCMEVQIACAVAGTAEGGLQRELATIRREGE